MCLIVNHRIETGSERRDDLNFYLMIFTQFLLFRFLKYLNLLLEFLLLVVVSPG